MAINNPLIPGDPFSYDLKWIIKKIKNHSEQITDLLASLPDDDHIKELIAQMIDSGEISAMALQSLNIFNVKDYGAIGDGVTNDYDAIVKTYDAAKEVIGIIYFPDGTYLINNGLVFDEKVHVVMNGTLYYPLAAEPALTVGGSDVISGARLELRAVGIGPANAGSIGVMLKNLNACRIVLDYVEKFETAVECVGSGAGFQNNVLYIGNIYRFGTGILLTSEDNGFCNENLFIGGRIVKFSDVTVSTTGIKITASAGHRYQNNNVFLKPNVENNDVGLDLEYANANAFENVRTENCTNAYVISNDSQNNKINVGYGIETSLNGLNDTLPYRKRTFLNRNVLHQYSTGSLYSRAARNASHGSVADLYIFNGSNTSLAAYSGDLLYDVNNEKISVSNAARYYMLDLDVTSDGTDVIHWRLQSNANTARGIFIMFDENGQRIATAPKFFSEQTAAAFAISNSSVFRYSASTYGYSFVIPSDCKRIWLGFQNGANASLEGITVESTAAFSVRKHAPVLPAIPTYNGPYPGFMVQSTTGSNIWLWNGTAWTALS